MVSLEVATYWFQSQLVIPFPWNQVRLVFQNIFLDLLIQYIEHLFNYILPRFIEPLHSDQLCDLVYYLMELHLETLSIMNLNFLKCNMLTKSIIFIKAHPTKFIDYTVFSVESLPKRLDMFPMVHNVMLIPHTKLVFKMRRVPNRKCQPTFIK